MWNKIIKLIPLICVTVWNSQTKCKRGSKFFIFYFLCVGVSEKAAAVGAIFKYWTLMVLKVHMGSSYSDQNLDFKFLKVISKKLRFAVLSTGLGQGAKTPKTAYNLYAINWHVTALVVQKPWNIFYQHPFSSTSRLKLLSPSFTRGSKAFK